MVSGGNPGTWKSYKDVSRKCCDTRKMALLKCTGGLRKYRMMLSKAWCTRVKTAGWRRTTCRNGGNQNNRKIWSQLLDDDEARNDLMRSIAWMSTDFPRQVVGETERGRAPVTFTQVCDYCKLFPVEEFLWWVTANHGEGRKKLSMSGWWCGAPFAYSCRLGSRCKNVFFVVFVWSAR